MIALRRAKVDHFTPFVTHSTPFFDWLAASDDDDDEEEEEKKPAAKPAKAGKEAKAVEVS